MAGGDFNHKNSQIMPRAYITPKRPKGTESSAFSVHVSLNVVSKFIENRQFRLFKHLLQGIFKTDIYIYTIIFLFFLDF